MEENLYFAYVSNLDLEQMAQRCPDAEIVGPVRLENYCVDAGYAQDKKQEETNMTIDSAKDLQMKGS